MRLDCALLCDAVTVREDLLHIIGGGITRLWRPQYPAPLNLAIALRVQLHPTEAERRHTIDVHLIGEDGASVGEIKIEFELNLAMHTLRPGEQPCVPLAIPLHGLPIPAACSYSFEILVDGVHAGSVPFVAEERPISAQTMQLEGE